MPSKPFLGDLKKETKFQTKNLLQTKAVLRFCVLNENIFINWVGIVEFIRGAEFPRCGLPFAGICGHFGTGASNVIRFVVSLFLTLTKAKVCCGLGGFTVIKTGNPTSSYSDTPILFKACLTDKYRPKPLNLYNQALSRFNLVQPQFKKNILNKGIFFVPASAKINQLAQCEAQRA